MTLALQDKRTLKYRQIPEPTSQIGKQTWKEAVNKQAELARGIVGNAYAATEVCM
jgi:hypothetical protein